VRVPRDGDRVDHVGFGDVTLPPAATPPGTWISAPVAAIAALGAGILGFTLGLAVGRRKKERY